MSLTFALLRLIPTIRARLGAVRSRVTDEKTLRGRVWWVPSPASANPPAPEPSNLTTPPLPSATPTSARVTVTRIRPDEHALALALSPHPHQQSFVASNAESLEDAADDPDCVPLLIRADGQPVGFAMYTVDEDDGNYWIYRLMIDARHQGQGHARAALRQILGMLSGLPDCPCVILGVKPENEAARRLYEQAGFRPTGELIGGEQVLKYEF